MIGIYERNAKEGRINEEKPNPKRKTTMGRKELNLSEVSRMATAAQIPIAHIISHLQHNRGNSTTHTAAALSSLNFWKAVGV